MIATTTVRPPSSSFDSSNDATANGAAVSVGPPSTAGVLRVNREIENIGERVPMSKKRITWRFVFADSQQVHTVTLEHSRISAKKRLRLDGRRLFTSEQYCAGDWRYEFHVSKSHTAKFCVAIKDVKATVVEERSLDSIYQLTVDGRVWDALEERSLPGSSTNSRSSSVWSSELYARRVSRDERTLERPDDESKNKAIKAHCVSWTFAFGLEGTIHTLEVRDLDRGDDAAGEFVVILDSRLLARVNHDDIDQEVWTYEYKLFGQHLLAVHVSLESSDNDENTNKKFEFFIDGCGWTDLSETDFVLQPQWFPVYSRTRGSSYFRNTTTNVSQWERPIMSRDGGVAIDVPRRLSKQAMPLPMDHFDADGIVRLSTGHDNQLLEPAVVATAPPPPLGASPFYASSHSKTADVGNNNNKENDSVNLLDFSEMAVHVSPTAKPQDTSTSSFDPFAHIAAQQQIQRRTSSSSNQQPLDLLS